MDSERLPFISQGDAYMAVGSPDRWVQLVRYRIIYYSYIMASQVKEISFLDFLAYPWGSSVQHIHALSCRNGARV